jgi:hypothetical protein
MTVAMFTGIAKTGLITIPLPVLRPNDACHSPYTSRGDADYQLNLKSGILLTQHPHIFVMAK